MLRKLVILLLTATVPLMFMAVVWQASRYSSLREEVQALERQQYVWIDSNRKILTGIAVLESPGRIDDIARNNLNLKKAVPEDVLKVVVGGRN